VQKRLQQSGQPTTQVALVVLTLPCAFFALNVQKGWVRSKKQNISQIVAIDEKDVVHPPGAEVIVRKLLRMVER